MPIQSMVTLFFVGCATAVFAQKPSRGTPAEAQAMLKKAVAHYEKVGRTQALADFTAKKPPFVDRDLYVFCFGGEKTVTAHGADTSLVGTDIDTIVDVDGKHFGTEMWTVGSKPGGGSVEYRWMNPVTKQVEPKVSFVQKVGTDICGVGAYK
jgi:cytochrome c